MHKRREIQHPEVLEVQALYTLTTLARVANVSRNVIRRILRTNDVEMVRSGRCLLIPIAEIKEKIPTLWESLKAVETLRHAS